MSSIWLLYPKAGGIMLLITALENENSDDQEYMLNLYEQYKRIMFHTAKKFVSDFTTVEDLVQDSLVKLIPKISTMRKLSGCTLSAYIVCTVRNTAKNHLRHQTIENSRIIHVEFEDYDAELTSEELSPEELLFISERMGEFYQILARLPDADQDLLTGKYILELGDVELAKMLNCKPGSIRMMLTRARRRALEMMKEGAFSYDET